MPQWVKQWGIHHHHHLDGSSRVADHYRIEEIGNFDYLARFKKQSKCKEVKCGLALFTLTSLHHNLNHGDFKTWKHFPHYWCFVQGIYLSPVDSLYKRPVMQSFDVIFPVSLVKPLNKQLRDWWNETTSSSCDVTVMSWCDICHKINSFTPSAAYMHQWTGSA